MVLLKSGWGMAVQTWTPDGYWVDERGVWKS